MRRTKDNMEIENLKQEKTEGMTLGLRKEYTFDEIDEILDIVDKIPADPSYIPSVEEMKEHQVEKNIEQFLPYLLWVSGMAAGSKFQKDTIRYITQILDRNCVA